MLFTSYQVFISSFGLAGPFVIMVNQEWKVFMCASSPRTKGQNGQFGIVISKLLIVSGKSLSGNQIVTTFHLKINEI